MRISWISKIQRTVLLLLLSISVPAVLAADLRIGFKAEITSADPHVLNGANRNIWSHVYDSLTVQDENLRTKPSLALSWRNIDPTTWEFKLRPNVTFHNGAALTADDVKFSLDRARALNGPRTFRTYLRSVDSVSASGPLTLIVKTKGVNPTLVDNLSLIAILPKSIGEVNEESFVKGKSAIGSGPYKFVSWAHGQSVVLARNAAYWGEKEPWETVTFQFVSRDPARASALLAGSVDVIDGATANVSESFKNSNKIETSATTSYMLNYLYFDRSRPSPTFVKNNEGTSVTKNPFDDLKVRRAVMLAVNRDGIIKHLMKGDAEPASQFVPPGFFGHDDKLSAPPNDLVRAKGLLAEAGFPNGFKLTLHCSNDRYLNDAKVCEALGQVFTQIGIKTDVATMPFAVFQGRAAKGEFSMAMLGIGAVTGDSLQPMTALSRTQDKSSGGGANNYGRYSDAGTDELLDKAGMMLNEKSREDLQKSAARRILEDVAIIPLMNQKASWAFRKGLSVKPRSDGFTLAMNIREKK